MQQGKLETREPDRLNLPRQAARVQTARRCSRRYRTRLLPGHKWGPVDNADGRSAHSINMFGFSREAHGYWKTTGRFRNHGIPWLSWSRAASRMIGLGQRVS
jgi:hypothetical protein